MKKSLAGLLLLFWPAVLPLLPAVSYAAETAALSAEEQNRAAFKAFEKILELTEAEDRKTVLPEMETVYREIIEKYPLASLAQESHLRLMMLYLNDFSPRVYDRAEAVWEHFVKTYPDSKLRNIMDRTLAEAYYKDSKWDKLLRFFTPSIKKSIASNSFPRVFDIFMYAEAKFGLNDMVEAEKGFKIVTSLFPETVESKYALKRLEEIRAKQPAGQ